MVVNCLGYTLIKPDASEIDSDAVAFHYDELSDTLFVHFFGEALPAFTLDVTEVENLRVELDTNRIVGLQIDTFLGHAIRVDPRYVVWAVRAEIPSSAIVAALSDTEPRALHAAAVKMAVDDLDYASD